MAIIRVIYQKLQLTSQITAKTRYSPPPQMSNKTNKSTLTNLIQHDTGSPSHPSEEEIKMHTHEKVKYNSLYSKMT